ncbi:MAG: insulinase family protein, partial [Phycisphaerales bacterium]|nr:insulinase family protein [Phycisphaerales bacterium]
EGLAAEVSAGQDSGALSSIFRITVMTKPDADLGKVEKIVSEEVTRLINEGPTAAELEQRKTQIEVGKLTRLQSIEARADALNEYLYYFGFNAGDASFNPADGLKRDLDRYQNATAESCKAWAKKVLTLDACLIGQVLPEEPQRVQSPRDLRPVDGPASPFIPPTPATFTLSNGADAMVFTRPGLPLVSVGMLFTPPSGVTWDPATKAGRSTVMASMLSEGTGDMDGAAFAARMQSLGASFTAGAGVEGFTATVSVLKKNLDPAVALAASAVLKPRLDGKDFERVKALRVDALHQEMDEPRAVAPKVSARLLFGDGTAYGTPTGGYVKTVEGLTPADAKAAHAEVVEGGKLTVVVAGDITPDEAKALLEKHLGARKAAGAKAASDAARVLPAQVAQTGMRVYIVDRPGAVQTMVHLRAPGFAASDPDRAKLAALNTLLGGSFTSRINNNLREVHGYTYGARTAFSSGPTTGSFTASSAVRADATGAAIKEFMGELQRVRTGDVSDAEAAKARAVASDNMTEPFGTIGGTVVAAISAVEDRLPWSSLAEEFAQLKGLDAAAVNATAKQAVDLDHAVLVLVGDKGLIRSQLEKTPEVKGLLANAVEVTAEGDRK